VFMVDRISWRGCKSRLRSIVHRSIDWLVRAGPAFACCNVAVPVIWIPEAVDGQQPTGGCGGWPRGGVTLTPAELAAWSRLMDEARAPDGREEHN
jgi:hypothetical protein